MLKEKLKQHRIILASQSPRRKQLLAGLDIDFEVCPLYADESYPPELEKEQITEFLCKKKAESYTQWKANEILITADTIVCCGNEVLEKPENAGEAQKMLKKLSGRTHEVITSVGIFSQQKESVFSDKTEVTFAELAAEEIKYYVEKYQPYDKAGSYGVQEWIGYVGVQEMRGSYFTVMGLPTFLLYQKLKMW